MDDVGNETAVDVAVRRHFNIPPTFLRELAIHFSFAVRRLWRRPRTASVNNIVRAHNLCSHLRNRHETSTGTVQQLRLGSQTRGGIALRARSILFSIREKKRPVTQNAL